ncbi:MAG: HMA2 domain-containing protein [Crocosphaera sp.]
MNDSQLTSNSSDLVLSSETNSLMVPQILSLTPGRIRFRIDLSHNSKDEITFKIANLENQLAIEKVRTNLGIGSVTIFYDSQSINMREFLDKLREFGFTFSENSTHSLLGISNSSKTAIYITQMTNQINQLIKQGSNHIVDLRVLIPFIFGLLAWRQLMLKGWQLETIPWYVLAWYGFDSFMKFKNSDQNSQNP